MKHQTNKKVEIMENLTFQNIVEFAQNKGKRFEAFTPFMDRWNERTFENTRVGVELKPNVWFWWNVYDDGMVLFDHRYNQANGHVMKSFKQAWKAEKIIRGLS